MASTPRTPASFILLYQEPVTGDDCVRASTQTNTNAREETEQGAWATRTKTDARENDDSDIQAAHTVFQTNPRNSGTRTKTGAREEDDDDIHSKHVTFRQSMGTETVTHGREQPDTDLTTNIQAVFPPHRA